MKFTIPFEWLRRKAKAEAACPSVEAGCPPTPREMWLAEVRRLLVTKYAVDWPENEVASYAEALAETFFDDDPEHPEKPDDAIDDDFRAGL